MGRNDNSSTKRLQAVCLLMFADSEWLSSVCNYTKNNTLLVRYNVPKTPTVAHKIIYWYKKPTPPRQTHAPPGVVTIFHHDDTVSKTVPGNYGQSFTDVMGYLWQKMGHYTEKWPSSTSSTYVGYQLLIPYFWGPTKGPHFGFWAPPLTSQDYTYDESRMTGRRLSGVL